MRPAWFLAEGVDIEKKYVNLVVGRHDVRSDTSTNISYRQYIIYNTLEEGEHE